MESLMTTERLRGPLIATAAAAAGGALLYHGVPAAYNRWANNYRQGLIDRMPLSGDEQSSLPLYQAFIDSAETIGITEWTAAGGLTKQALRDPETEFDPDNKLYIVRGLNNKTMEKATLYRPEGNVRDLDIRTKKVRLGDTEDHALSNVGDRPVYVNKNGLLVDEAGEGVEEMKFSRYLKIAMQDELNETARRLGMGDQGLELSLFFYEEDPGKFRPYHYATRTEFDPLTNTERVFATTGQEAYIEVEDPWTCIVEVGDETVEIPVDAPATHLGRTSVRAIVPRDRDLEDVQAAVDNLQAQGLGDEVLGDTWDQYVELRHELDGALSPASVERIRQRDGVLAAKGLELVGPLADRKSDIESSAIAVAIRDQGHWIGKTAARLMGAA